MKTAIKRILVTTMSAASIFGVVSSSFADEVSQPTTPMSIEEAGNVTNGEGGIITPYYSEKPFSINFNGTRTSDTQMYITSTDVPWAKVQVYNSGKADMIITITKGSPTGQVMNQLILPPGKQDNMHGMMPTPGTYYVNFSSTNYLNGSASCRIASTSAELGL